MTRLRRRFTLLELMVVVGIIVLMTAMAIPAISKFLDGQSLTQSGRIVQSAFNEARRAAITQRARNYIVFFRTEDPSRPGAFLYGMRRYRERVGYDGEPQFLLPGAQFDMETGSSTSGTGLTTPTAGRIRGIRAVLFENLPEENNAELFGDTRRPKDVTGWIEFRRDGTINLKGLDSKSALEVGGENLFDLNALFEVTEDNLDDWSGEKDSTPDTDMNLRETGDYRVDKRCFIDIDPNTGRLNFRVLQVTDK